jgi:hypothetical protein
MRWSEEVLLLREEMRRVVAFLQWNGEWWEERQDVLQGLEMEHNKGVNAYARKQAHIRRTIQMSFKDMWYGLDDFMVLGIGGDNEILDLAPATTSRLLNLFHSVEPTSSFP